VLGGEPQPERDEYRSRQTLERAADPCTPEEVARPRYRGGVAGEPRNRHGAEKEPEEKQPEEGGPAELRQEAGEEDCHLRIAEVADEPLAECRPPSQASVWARRDRPRSPTEGAGQRLNAEEHKVGRARESQREKRWLGRLEQRNDACARGERPARLPRPDSSRRQDSASPSAQQGVPDSESRVRARSEDDDRRHAHKRNEVSYHARNCGRGLSRLL
jgi:hypothetical protein